MDTANYLSDMDLTMTCDTSFAHLALNMGKPTILVYDIYLHWRWKNNIYPAVKLINQLTLTSETLGLINFNQ